MAPAVLPRVLLLISLPVLFNTVRVSRTRLSPATSARLLCWVSRCFSTALPSLVAAVRCKTTRGMTANAAAPVTARLSQNTSPVRQGERNMDNGQQLELFGTSGRRVEVHENSFIWSEHESQFRRERTVVSALVAPGASPLKTPWSRKRVIGFPSQRTASMERSRWYHFPFYNNPVH